MRQSHSMNEHDLLNIYFMCNVSFQIKQKLERVEMGGVLITYRSDIALQQRFFVSCVREGVNFPLTVRICRTLLVSEPLSRQLSNQVSVQMPLLTNRRQNVNTEVCFAHEQIKRKYVVKEGFARKRNRTIKRR